MMVSSASVVLPVHNQGDHIAAITREYIDALEKLPLACELVLVTNGCRDESPEICRTLTHQYKSVRTINTAKSGWGHAVKEGLRQANGDLLCYTNSARTSPEILTLTLLYGATFPNAVIKANRKVRDSWRRRLGSLIYNLECRALFDLPTWDINGTPKVFPRTFNKLLNLKSDDDLIDVEFNIVCRQAGYQVLEVPVLSTRRHGGKSTTNYNSALKMYVGAIKLWQELN